ncbi:MAG: signal peptidase II [bacterium]
MFYILAAVVLASDQIAKLLAAAFLKDSPPVPLVPGFFNLYYQENTGGAFSLLESHTLFLTIFSAVAVIAIIYWHRALPRHERLAQAALGLILGGALGNLIDRFRLGYVVDFFHAYWRDYHWPVFNLADSAICIGVALFLVAGLRQHKTQSSEAEAESKRAERSAKKNGRPLSHDPIKPADR